MKKIKFAGHLYKTSGELYYEMTERGVRVYANAIDENGRSVSIVWEDAWKSFLMNEEQIVFIFSEESVLSAPPTRVE